MYRNAKCGYERKSGRVPRRKLGGSVLLKVTLEIDITDEISKIMNLVMNFNSEEVATK